MNVRVTSNAHSVAGDLLAAGARARGAVEAVVATEGATLQRKVKANASGRPGPRVITGDYRRSIGLSVRRTPTWITAEVGSNDIRARRLEMGFWGLTDSLGRLFHQPARPHFGPAADDMEKSFPVAVGLAVSIALRDRA